MAVNKFPVIKVWAKHLLMLFLLPVSGTFSPLKSLENMKIPPIKHNIRGYMYIYFWCIVTFTFLCCPLFQIFSSKKYQNAEFCSLWFALSTCTCTQLTEHLAGRHLHIPTLCNQLLSHFLTNIISKLLLVVNTLKMCMWIFGSV
jgi:hypothetical protein